MKLAELESHVMSQDKEVANFMEGCTHDMTVMANRIAKLESIVRNQQAQITTNESTIAIQSNTINVLRDELGRAYEKIDGNLQYSKRMNLKIQDVILPDGRESQEQVQSIVSEVSADLGVQIGKDDILRAHRSGPKKVDNGVKRQDIIIRFRSWETRCNFYKARPTRKSPRKKPTPPPHGFKSISLDITKRNADLVKKARRYLEEKLPGVEEAFAFADINCNKAISYFKKLYYFSSEEELDEKMDEILRKHFNRSVENSLVQP